jgi:hypothetical protein
MVFKKFVKILFNSKQPTPAELTKLQNNIDNSLTPIIQNASLDNQILTNITLLPSQINTINHQLGRTLTGWIVVSKSATTDIWDNQLNNNQTNLTLELYTTYKVIVSLSVF